MKCRQAAPWSASPGSIPGAARVSVARLSKARATDHLEVSNVRAHTQPPTGGTTQRQSNSTSEPRKSHGRPA